MRTLPYLEVEPDRMCTTSGAGRTRARAVRTRLESEPLGHSLGIPERMLADARADGIRLPGLRAVHVENGAGPRERADVTRGLHQTARRARVNRGFACLRKSHGAKSGRRAYTQRLWAPFDNGTSSDGGADANCIATAKLR